MTVSEKLRMYRGSLSFEELSKKLRGEFSPEACKHFEAHPGQATKRYLNQFARAFAIQVVDLMDDAAVERLQRFTAAQRLYGAERFRCPSCGSLMRESKASQVFGGRVCDNCYSREVRSFRNSNEEHHANVTNWLLFSDATEFRDDFQRIDLLESAGQYRNGRWRMLPCPRCGETISTPAISRRVAVPICAACSGIEEMEDAGFEPTMPLSEWHLFKETKNG